MKIPAQAAEADRLADALARSQALAQPVSRVAPNPVTLRCNKSTCTTSAIICWQCSRKTCKHHTSKTQIGYCTVCALVDRS